MGQESMDEIDNIVKPYCLWKQPNVNNFYKVNLRVTYQCQSNMEKHNFPAGMSLIR